MRASSCGSVWSMAFSVTLPFSVVDVDVQLRVAREREEQVVHAHVVDHDAVRLESGGGLWLGKQRSDLHRRRDLALGLD